MPADAEPARAAERWLEDACRAYLNPEVADTRSLLDIDPQQLLQLAPAHQLEPILHSLARADRIAGNVPEELRESWLACYCLTTLRNGRRLASLGRIATECRGAGLALLALKGPVHIARLHRDPGVRQMIDLDLLCREEELGEVCDVLRSLGYRPLRETTSYHLEFVHAEAGDKVELHFDVYESLANRGEFLERLRQEARPCEVAGVRFDAPSPECCIVFDLGHLVHHDLQVGLRQLVDFAAQLARRDEIDEDALQELLRTTDLGPEFAGLTALLGAGLGWLPTAEAVARTAASDTAWLAQLREHWAALPDRVGRTPPLTEASYRPGLFRKIGQVARTVFPPASRLQQTTGAESVGALRARHALQTLSSGLRNVARSGLRPPPAISLKRDLYRRRARRSRGLG